jgi:hypothetical protein
VRNHLIPEQRYKKKRQHNRWKDQAKFNTSPMSDKIPTAFGRNIRWFYA